MAGYNAVVTLWVGVALALAAPPTRRIFRTSRAEKTHTQSRSASPGLSKTCPARDRVTRIGRWMAPKTLHRFRKNTRLAGSFKPGAWYTLLSLSVEIAL